MPLVDNKKNSKSVVERSNKIYITSMSNLFVLLSKLHAKEFRLECQWSFINTNASTFTGYTCKVPYVTIAPIALEKLAIKTGE